MTSSFRIMAWLLFCSLAFTSCQSGPDEASVAADLNSSTPAVAAQAQKVQQLRGQIQRQEAVIESERKKLDALQLQLKGAQENLQGVKQQAQATP